MNAPVRGSRAAAVVLAAALLASCSSGGGASAVEDATATSAATAISTTTDAAATPAALLDRWVGPPRTIGALGTGTSAAFVEISEGFLMLETGISDNPKAFGSDVTAEGDDTLVLTLAGDVLDCVNGDIGRYTWILSPQATTLTLTAVGDDCEARRAAIEGQWTHTACRLDGRDCLGPVEAGTYSTNRWNPYGSFTYGQATFTVPDGWAVTYDSQAALFIGLASDYAADPDPKPWGIRAWVDIAPAKQDPTECDDGADADFTVALGATAIADWMAGLPNLATTRSTLQVGDLTAEVVDAEITGEPTCDWGNVLVVSRTSKPDPFAYGILTDQHTRIVLVDVLPGRTAAMFLDDEGHPGFEALEAAAMPIVESFRFSPTPPST